MMNFDKFIAKLKYEFFTMVHLLIAFSLILGLFYIRFLPRVSRDLWQNMNHYQLIIVVFILSCIIFNIYNTLKIIGYIKTKEPPAFLKKILDALHAIIQYIYDVLENFYEFVWFILNWIALKFDPKVEIIQYRVLRPLVKSFTNSKHSPYYFIILISLKFIPIMIFVLVLLYDVIFCQHFDYTFRCIPLLLITLLEPFFLFIFKNFRKCHLEGLGSFLIITQMGNTAEATFRLRPDLEYLPYEAKDFDDFFYNHFYPTNLIFATLEKYEDWKHNKIHVYHIQLVLQSLRLIVYTYILIYGII